MPTDNSADWAAAANAASSAAGILAQSSLNKDTRKWNEQMYARQRTDALADWNMTNEYNSPKAQMQRFRDANLNPNLIYGQQNEGATVRSSDTGTWNPRVPDYEGFTRSSIGAYQSIKMQEAQMDNMESQRAVYAQQQALLSAQTGQVLQNTSGSQFDLSQRQRLADISAQAAEQNLRAVSTNTDISIMRNAREALQTSQNLAEGLQRILTMQLDRSKTELGMAETRQGMQATGLKMGQTIEETKNLTQQRTNMQASLELLKQEKNIKALDEVLASRGLTKNDFIGARMAWNISDNLSNPHFQKMLKENATKAWNWFIDKTKADSSNTPGTDKPYTGNW